MNLGISTEDLSYRKYISVLDTAMAYVDVGNGDPDRQMAPIACRIVSAIGTHGSTI
jgi:hypothetical protein